MLSNELSLFSFRDVTQRFSADQHGAILIFFAFALIPIMLFVGAAIDYSRALNAKSQLQSAIDSSVLTAAANNYSTAVATSWFAAQHEFSGATAASPTYVSNADGSLTGNATATLPTVMMGLVGVPSIAIRASATVSGNATTEKDCIIALGHGAGASTSTLTLNGSPSVNLQGCSLRSNESMNCNGHNGSAISSIAVGTAGSCANPVNSARPIKDIYGPLASNITKACGGDTTGLTWTAGSSTPTGVITSTRSGYAEYHVCGSLTLTGSGYLTGASPTTDTVIVIENGDLDMASDATISANRVTFVLTGSNSFSHEINFPNGKGHLATLTLSPSTSSANPWAGIAIFQDPALTSNVDVSWGPAGAMNVNGVVYLPNSNVTLSGNAGSGNSPCTVFVTNTFTSNGNVSLNFSQAAANCTALSVKQYTSYPTLIH